MTKDVKLLPAVVNAELAAYAETANATTWWEESLHAAQWAALPAVAPNDAALLLSGFEPATVTPEAAETTTTGMGQGGFTRLQKAFTAAPPAPRPLAAWAVFAASCGLPVHPWYGVWAAARWEPRAVPWWRAGYDIMELAQHAGERLEAQGRSPSLNAVAAAVAKHISDKEARKTPPGTTPRKLDGSTLKKTVLKGWAYTPDSRL